MAKSKVLTQDQLDQLDTFCSNFIESGDELKTYLEEVISKRNDGYGIVRSIREQITTLQDKIFKLSQVVETNNWDELDDDEEGGYSDHDYSDDSDDE